MKILGPDIGLIVGDLRDPVALRQSVQNFRKIAFVAGSNGIAGRGTPREIEYDGVAAMAEAWASVTAERFVLLSSAAVTQPEHPPQLHIQRRS